MDQKTTEKTVDSERDRLVALYKAQFDGWDFDTIMATAMDNPSEPIDPDDDSVVGRCYIGSVMNLYPSGKYYMPWATGNLDVCPNCKGSGSVANPEANEGDHAYATGLMRLISQTAIQEYGAYTEWPWYIHNEVENLRKMKDRSCPTKDCYKCGTYGFHEAFQDEVWRETLEEVAEIHGMWFDHGEGCPTDLFLCVNIENDAEDDDDVEDDAA